MMYFHNLAANSHHGFLGTADRKGMSLLQGYSSSTFKCAFSGNLPAMVAAMRPKDTAVSTDVSTESLAKAEKSTKDDFMGMINRPHLDIYRVLMHLNTGDKHLKGYVFDKLLNGEIDISSYPDYIRSRLPDIQTVPPHDGTDDTSQAAPPNDGADDTSQAAPPSDGAPKMTQAAPPSDGAPKMTQAAPPSDGAPAVDISATGNQVPLPLHILFLLFLRVGRSGRIQGANILY